LASAAKPKASRARSELRSMADAISWIRRFASVRIFCCSRMPWARSETVVLMRSLLPLTWSAARAARHALDAAREVVGLVRQPGALVHHHPRREVAAADLRGGGVQRLEGAREIAGEHEAEGASDAERDARREPGREGDAALLEQDR
jgi:hypothetical protein